MTGLLQFASKVIRPGCPFIRRLYAMQDIGSHPDHFIRLNLPARADILWWYLFAEDWNGISMFWDISKHTANITVTSDASGSWGCGAFWKSKWFHFPWPSSLQGLPITTKELIPIVVATALFGHKWRGFMVEFKVDNMAMVHVLNNTYSKDQHLMHLIRTLVFLACHFEFWFSASHIEGKANIIADTLSRNNLQQPGMDIHRLDQVVQQYYSAALTSSTHKTCKEAERKYLSFCNEFSITPIPTSENVLCYFTACMGQQNLSASTIRTYLLGIRQLQIAGGFPDPLIDHMPRLRQVLKGIKVQAAKSGKSIHPRLPITPSILRKLRATWLSGNLSYDNLMPWAASVTTFFTFCQSGETTVENENQYDPKVHLSYSDIAVDNSASPNVISLNIKQSKTDQLRKGVKVVLGRTNDDLCPVTALLLYLSHQGNSPGPLFCWHNKTPLSKAKFVKNVRLALLRANLLADKYTGHSFRIGAATTAASAGIEDSTIQTLGRWQSSSYLLYVKLDPCHMASLSSTLA